MQVTLAPNEDAPPGLILPNGDINWNCPCLGGMAVGPCGPEFREAFSCFHYSTEEPKGKDCIEKFSTMQECMSQYPELYPEKKKDEEGAEPAAKAEEEPAAAAAEPAAEPAAEQPAEPATEQPTEPAAEAASSDAATEAVVVPVVEEKDTTSNDSAPSEEGKSDNSASTEENSTSTETVST